MSQIDLNILRTHFDKFQSYVHASDKKDGQFSFVEESGLLAKEEGYKSRIPGQARAVLSIDEWDETWIGSGEIRKRMYKVMDLASNLINFNSKIDFRKHFESEQKEYNPESESVIYQIFKGDDDPSAFEHAIKVFGAKYPIVSYLFYVKDEAKYLPVSPTSFDRAFKELNIEFTMSFKCSWSNYAQYLAIMNEIRELMAKYLDISHEVRMLDAHSFVWIVGEKKYQEWSPAFDDINTPLKPKSIIREENDVIRYQCARCEQIFKKARRCPDCGQAVED